MEKTDIIERHTKALESVVGLSGLSKIECHNIIRDAVNEALNIAGVVISEERAEVCQSFVVDTTTSSATICANCKKEAWEHGQT